MSAYRVSLRSRSLPNATPMTCDFASYGEAMDFLLRRGYVRTGLAYDRWEQRFCTAEIEEVGR